MRKLKLIKSLLLNISLGLLLFTGLNSCGSEDSSETESVSETEEVFIKKSDTDENSEAKEASKTKVIARRNKDLKVYSKTENADLEGEVLNEDVDLVEDFGDIGFEGTYNYMDIDEPPMFDECEERVTKEEKTDCFEKFLYKNLHKNIKYPEDAKELNVEGETFVGFVVDNSGVVSQVKVVKGSGAAYEKTEKAINEYIDAYNSLDQAALEAIKATPKTRPAMVNGEPVNVQYVVPVVFEIE